MSEDCDHLGQSEIENEDLDIENEEEISTDNRELNTGHSNLKPFDKPFRREYILRSSVSRPAPYSRPSPQRMYCLITNHEFRLAGAFTEDTMFF